MSSNQIQNQNYYAVIGNTNQDYEIVSVWESESEARIAMALEAELTEEYVSLCVKPLC